MNGAASVEAMPPADADASPALVRWRQLTDLPLLVLAVGSVPLLLLELARHRLPEGDRVFMDVVNIVVLVAFAGDFIVGVALARSKRSHVRSEWMTLLIVAASR